MSTPESTPSTPSSTPGFEKELEKARPLFEQGGRVVEKVLNGKRKLAVRVKKSDHIIGSWDPELKATLEAEEERLKSGARGIEESPEAPGIETPTLEEPPITGRGVKVEWETSLQAFQMFEAGMSPVDVMADLRLKDDQVLKYLQRYNEIRQEQARRDLFEERFIYAWYELAKRLGELRRESCGEYDETGSCGRWETSDVEPSFRKRYAGLFKTVGGRLRFVVLKHPEICSICPRRLEGL